MNPIDFGTGTCTPRCEDSKCYSTTARTDGVCELDQDRRDTDSFEYCEDIKDDCKAEKWWKDAKAYTFIDGRDHKPLRTLAHVMCSKTCPANQCGTDPSRDTIQQARLGGDEENPNGVGSATATDGVSILISANGEVLLLVNGDWSNVLTLQGSDDASFGQAIDVAGDWAVVASSTQAFLYVVARRRRRRLQAADVIDPGTTIQAVAVVGDFVLVVQETTTLAVYENTEWTLVSSVDDTPCSVLARSTTTDVILCADDMTASAFRLTGDGTLTGPEVFPLPMSDLGGFGSAAAISGDLAVVGAQDAVHVYEYQNNGNWTLTAQLNGDEGSSFGASVAIDSELIYVGAPTATVGDALQAGRVVVFLKVGGQWEQIEVVSADIPVTFAGFGSSLTASRGLLAVGAPLEPGAESGALNVGAGYIFTNSFDPSITSAPSTTFLYPEEEIFTIPPSPGSSLPPTGTPTESTSVPTEVPTVTPTVDVPRAWTPLYYAKSPFTDSFDAFGHAVSLSGDLALIGVPDEDGCSSIPGGEIPIDTCPNSGAAFVLDVTDPSVRAYVKSPRPSDNDAFGDSVALSADGRVAVIGAPKESSCDEGVQNDVPTSAGCSEAGAGFVFVKEDDWTTVQSFLKARRTLRLDHLGTSVGLNGDGSMIVLGAPGDDSCLEGAFDDGPLDGDQSCGDSGAAHIFRRNTTTGDYEYSAYLSYSRPGSAFGRSVGIFGTTIVVAAPDASDCTATVVNNPPYDGDQTCSGWGAVFVFENGVPTAMLKPSIFETQGFGTGLAIVDGVVLVGSEDPRLAPVYVFVKSNDLWAAAGTVIVPPSAAVGPFTGDGHGKSIALSPDGSLALVGAPDDFGCGFGVLLDDVPAGGSSCPSGAAFLYTRTMDSWNFTAYLKSTNQGGRFGASVSLNNRAIVIGAPSEASCTFEISTIAATDTTCRESGAVYSYASVVSTPSTAPSPMPTAIPTTTLLPSTGFDDGVWQIDGYLKPWNVESGDSFGRSAFGAGDQYGRGMALKREIFVAVAWGEDSCSLETTNFPFGQDDDDDCRDVGAAYVFRRTGGWTFEAYLKPPRRMPTNSGRSLSVALSSDERVFVNWVNDAVFIFQRLDGNWTATDELSSRTTGTAAPGSSIAVDDDGSRVAVGGDNVVVIYVLGTGGWSLEAELQGPSDATSLHTSAFGGNVVLDGPGSTLLVGDPDDDSCATLSFFDGTRSTDDGCPAAGALYVYERVGTSWAMTAYLKAPDASPGRRFGAAAALAAGTMLIGVQAQQVGQLYDPVGTVYVFDRKDDASWIFQSSLQSPTTTSSNVRDGFGDAVALSRDGTTALIGSPADRGCERHVVNFFPSSSSSSSPSGDLSCENQGAVHVYERRTDWRYRAYLKASSPQPGGIFLGHSVAIDDNIAVAGADFDASCLFTIRDEPPFPGDYSCRNAGAAYAFKLSDSPQGGLPEDTETPTAVPSATPIPSSSSSSSSGWVLEDVVNGTNSFGHAVAVSGTTLVVGAPEDASCERGIFPEAQTDTGCERSGAAWIFRRLVDDEWHLEAFVKSATTRPFLSTTFGPVYNDEFGKFVAVSQDVVAIAAPYERSCATGIILEGNLIANDDDRCYSSGAVVILRRVGGSWSVVATLKPALSRAFSTAIVNAGDYTDLYGADVPFFGAALALSRNSNVLVVGEPGNSNGIGAAHVYSLDDLEQVEALLVATNGEPRDYLGTSVAVDAEGRTIIVLAPGEDSCLAFPLNGGESSVDDGCPDAGAVYVFDTESGDETAYLKHPFPEDAFGFLDGVPTNRGSTIATGISGDGRTIVVVARSSSIFQRGDIVYFFQKTTGWSFVQSATTTNEADPEATFLDNVVAISEDGAVAIVGGAIVTKIGDTVDFPSSSSSYAADNDYGRAVSIEDGMAFVGAPSSDAVLAFRLEIVPSFAPTTSSSPTPPTTMNPSSSPTAIPTATPTISKPPTQVPEFCYDMAMEDSFGDGWNGNFYHILDAFGTTVATGTLPSGDFGVDDICLRDGCYSFRVDDQGTGNRDISFQFASTIIGFTEFPFASPFGPVSFNATAGIVSIVPTCGPVASPSPSQVPTVAPTTSMAPSLSPGDVPCYVMFMIDIGGDGWNGNFYSVLDALGTTVASGSLETGNVGSDDVCLPNDCYSLIVVDAGERPDEVSWVFAERIVGEPPFAAPFGPVSFFTIDGALEFVETCPAPPVEMTPNPTPTSQTTTSPTSVPSLTVPTSSTPTFSPTSSPTIPSSAPTSAPTSAVIPTPAPTSEPSLPPTGIPSSFTPTLIPTGTPGTTPTSEPSFPPSLRQTSSPSPAPSKQTTTMPTAVPTGPPSLQPSHLQSHMPSANFTPFPTYSTPSPSELRVTATSHTAAPTT